MARARQGICPEEYTPISIWNCVGHMIGVLHANETKSEKSTAIFIETYLRQSTSFAFFFRKALQVLPPGRFFSFVCTKNVFREHSNEVVFSRFALVYTAAGVAWPSHLAEFQCVSLSRSLRPQNSSLLIGGIGTDTGCAGCKWVEQ